MTDTKVSELAKENRRQERAERRPICDTSARIAYAVNEYLEGCTDSSGEILFDTQDNECLAELMGVIDLARRGK